VIWRTRIETWLNNEGSVLERVEFVADLKARRHSRGTGLRAEDDCGIRKLGLLFEWATILLVNS
jgi:hypothetical protein